MTAEEIKEIIRKHYNSDEWIVLSELRTCSGYKCFQDGKPFTEKYIDLMAFNYWPSKQFTRIAFEIKVNRNDFLKELKHPEKYWLAMMYSHKFYFVAPKGMIDELKTPPGTGLIEIENDKIKIKKQAPSREASPLPDSFIASALKNALNSRRINESLNLS